jgi:hypothetical protein
MNRSFQVLVKPVVNHTVRTVIKPTYVSITVNNLHIVVDKKYLDSLQRDQTIYIESKPSYQYSECLTERLFWHP